VGKQSPLRPEFLGRLGHMAQATERDVHLVGRNASSTKPAKFLVFIVKNHGAPILVPLPECINQKPRQGDLKK